MSNIQEMVGMIEKMTLLELSELVKAVEEKFEVTASAPMATVAQSGDAQTGVAEEKTEFDLSLVAAGSNKIAAIKVVREITGLGLSAAKELVESAPKVLKEAIPKEEAESLLKKITDAGAQGEIK